MKRWGYWVMVFGMMALTFVAKNPGTVRLFGIIGPIDTQ